MEFFKKRIFLLKKKKVMTEPMERKRFIQACDDTLMGLLEHSNTTTAKRMIGNLPVKLRNELDPDLLALVHTMKRPIKQGTTTSDLPTLTLKQFRESAQALADDYATGRVPTVPKNKIRARGFERLAKKARAAQNAVIEKEKTKTQNKE